MSELEVFKRSYFHGRMIFIQGPKGTRKVRMAYRMLGQCQVQERETHVIRAREFSIRFMDHVSDFLLQGRRVFLVTDLHELAMEEHETFLRALVQARRMFFACGIRVLLITSRETALHRKIEANLPVFRLRVSGCGRENVDERVHWALELACRVTRKRVTHLSVSAADYLEAASVGSQDDDLIETLVTAVQRSERGVLQLHDLIQSDNAAGRDLDDFVTCCN